MGSSENNIHHLFPVCALFCSPLPLLSLLFMLLFTSVFVLLLSYLLESYLVSAHGLHYSRIKFQSGIQLKHQRFSDFFIAVNVVCKQMHCSNLVN